MSRESDLLDSLEHLFDNMAGELMLLRAAVKEGMSSDDVVARLDALVTKLKGIAKDPAAPVP